MSRRVLIGIDVGSTVLKAASYDRSTGRRLGGTSYRLSTRVTPDGERTQDAWRVWLHTRKLIRQLVAELRNHDCVDGLGVAAQGGSAVVVQAETGLPRSPLFLWNDMRFLPFMDSVKAAHPSNYWRTLADRSEPGWGLARMSWLQQSLPGLLNSASMYVGIGEWLFHRLTGVWQQDACNAHQIGCYDARRHTLTAKPLKTTGVSLHQIAPLRNGSGSQLLGQPAARELGLDEGIEVVGPFMDHEAGYMAVGSELAQPLQCSLGTAWVGNYCASKRWMIQSPFHFAIPQPMGPNRFMIQPLLTGNVCWDWALTTFLDRRISRALTICEKIFRQSLLPADGLIALPWINMPNVIWPQYLGSGTFFGVRSTTDPADLVRATALAMVCELRRVFEQPIQCRLIRSVVLGGGASKGRMFRSLIASAFAPLAVYLMQDEDWVGTRGALRPFSDRVGCMPSAPLPDKSRSERQAVNHRMGQYREVFDRLYENARIGQAIHVKNRSSAR